MGGGGWKVEDEQGRLCFGKSVGHRRSVDRKPTDSTTQNARNDEKREKRKEPDEREAREMGSAGEGSYHRLCQPRRGMVMVMEEERGGRRKRGGEAGDMGDGGSGLPARAHSTAGPLPRVLR
jgi:hypothetical protein